ncbi:ATPase, T2SS/T4P/T4SS family [Thiohalorhabdus sp.]|uniref:ATPase, T2SS/T4P/T4SS family n=1 Tax=Thiohalorhabdus sp. TaxID=3094134 RepID=UPI002FC3BCBA
MRILDQSGGSLELAKLGFLRAEYEALEGIIRQPQGMLLVTGPTGSGKTTTLYSVLSAINKEDVNIVTEEDPVEYQLAKINQVPVNPKAGMTFAAGLRSILRQDPNIIMVGEIRDQETAEIALESAETGHMVFSTLHTNSAVGAVTRFLDMDVPGYLLASSLSGVLAQRLLRRNCPDCSEPVEVGQGLRARYNIPDTVTFYEGQGCPTCDGQGTKGRMGFYELLLLDREIAEGINSGATEAELVDRARRNGMHLMFEDGLIKAMQGKVSLTEVLRGLEVPSGVAIDGGRLWEEADKTWAERATALVVSGEAGHAEMVASILRTGGLAVSVTDSGRQGLDRIRRQAPALVVADRDSSDLDGVALAESLRREPGLREVPLLLLADTMSVREETQALAAGADDFLAKPLDPERLMARVRRLQRRASETPTYPCPLSGMRAKAGAGGGECYRRLTGHGHCPGRG